MIPCLAITLTEIIKEEFKPYLPRIIATGLYIFCATQVSALTVTTLTNSDGDPECSLQEAIAAANENLATDDCSGTDFDTINFHPDLFISNDIDKLTLDLDITDIPLVISDDLEITLPAAVNIDGHEFQHEVNVTIDNDLGKNGVLFSIASDVSFELSGWKIDGSQSTDATIASLGNNTNLTLNSVVIENFANENTSFINSDGLIHTSDLFTAGSVSMNNSIFRNNHTSGNGAIFNIEASSLIIHSSFFSNNRTISNSLSRSGGAIALSGDTQADIINSSFFGNSATTHGGAIANLSNSGQLRIENSNFMLNSAIGHGGAIYTQGAISLFNSTFLINAADTDTEDEGTYQGGALFIAAEVSQATIHNSLFHLNRIIGSEPSDCSGPISSLEYSILLTADDCAFPESVISVNSEATNLPILGVLTEQSEFIGYVTTSPEIIDQGNPDGCVGIDGNTITTDIIGEERNIDATNGDEGVCDIGATEIKPLTLSISANQETFESTYDITLVEQESIPVKLTVENTGNAPLLDLNISAVTPLTYSLIIDDEEVNGTFTLESGFSLAAGETITFNVEIVPNTDTQSGVILFLLTAQNPHYVNLGSSSNTLLDILIEAPLETNQNPSDNSQVLNFDQGDEAESSGSGGGAMFWLMSLLCLFALRRLPLR